MKKVICLVSVIFSCFVLPAKGQIKPLSNGLSSTFSGSVVLTCSDSSGNVLFALKKNGVDVSTKNINYTISRWNGSVWHDSINFSVHTADLTQLEINDMEFYHGQIHITGGFDSIGGQAASIARWDGVNWTRLGGAMTGGYATRLEVQHKQLYAAGSFTSIGGTSMQRIAAWNGVSWAHLGTSPVNQGTNGEVVDIIRHKDKLCVLGTISTVNGSTLPVKNVAFWDSSSWSDAKFKADTVIEAASINDTLVILCSQRVMRNNGDSAWSDITYNYPLQPSDKLPYKYSNYITYAAKRFWVNRQPADKIHAIYYLEGNKWVNLVTDTMIKNNFPAGLDENKGRLVIYGKFTRNFSTILNHIGYIDTVPEVIRVSGKVYYDINNNCVYDMGDQPVPNRIVQFTNWQKQVNTDEYGNYDESLQKLLSDIRLVSFPDYAKYNCTDSIVFTDTSMTSLDFPLYIDTSLKDISLKLIANNGYRARKGGTEYYHIRVTNNIPVPRVVPFVLAYDNAVSSITPVSSGFISQSANRAYFSTVVPPLSTKDIVFTMFIDTTLSMGDTLKHWVYLDSALNAADTVKTDNRDTLVQKVTAPHDPNDKQSWPPDKIITPGVTTIRYQIRFQNVGNDKAIRVTVKDTVDVNIKPTEIYLNSSSHNYKFYVEGNNVMTWVFENINLPDSTSDPLGSQGYLNYSANLKSGLAIGTHIRNTALIYFDYEEPVRTNTVINVISDGHEGIKPVKVGNSGLYLYPNPANDMLMIRNISGKPMPPLVMYDLTGRMVWNGEAPGMQDVSVNTSFLPSGVYFIYAEGLGAAKLVIDHP